MSELIDGHARWSAIKSMWPWYVSHTMVSANRSVGGKIIWSMVSNVHPSEIKNLSEFQRDGLDYHPAGYGGPYIMDILTLLKPDSNGHYHWQFYHWGCCD